MRRIVILGSGGHAISVADVVLESLSGQDRIVGFIAPEMLGQPVVGNLAIIGNDEELAQLVDVGSANHFVVGVGTVNGGALQRARLFERAKAVGLKPLTSIHPSAAVSRWATLGDGSVVMAGAVVNARSTVGCNGIINTGAVVDHDANLGDHVHIAPSATLSGSVSVGDHSLVGVGATVKQGVTVGKFVTIAAGAVVVSDVPDDRVVMGVPARLAHSAE